MDRIIGRYTGSDNGTLIFVIGGIHGNEKAGKIAIELIMKMLEVEPVTNPDFKFYGRVVGLIGNCRAYKENKRFIDKDLNRIWEKEEIERIKAQNGSFRYHEESELLDLLHLIESEIEHYRPSCICILDLHTTSSEGGIFSIPSETEKSLELATKLHAPVIKGLLNGISGTTAHFFTEENFGHVVHTVIFEAGQHEDPLSVNRSIAGVINCMRSLGCVQGQDVENIHDKILVEHSRNLPEVSHILYTHLLRPEDGFVMNPGYKNFQPVRIGDELAHDMKGIIVSPSDGRILMPLYQPLGSEGFFIIQELGGFS